MSDGSEAKGRSPRRAIRASIVAVGALVVAAIVVWRFWSPPDGSQMNAESRRALIADATQAVALLENNDFEEAAQRLAALIERAPEETLPRRNLVLARHQIAHRLIQKVIGDPAGTAKEKGLIPAAVEEARREASAYVEFAPQSPIAHWLAAQAWLLELDYPPPEESRRQAIERLRQAAALSQDDPVMRYALFDFVKDADDEALRREGRDALAAAYRARPRNLTLLRHWLTSQAEAKDPTIGDTIQAAREVVGPLRPRLAVDLDELLDQAAEAAANGDWATALGRLRGFSSVVSNDDFTRSDFRQVDPHPLEYVVHQFGDAMYAGLGGEAPADGPNLSGVKLSPASGESWSAPPVTNPSDVKLIDLNLDMQIDLLALGDGKLQLWTRANETTEAGVEPSGQAADKTNEADAVDNGPWRIGAEIELPDGFDRFLAADLYVVDYTRRPMKSAPPIGSDDATLAAAFEAAQRHDTYQAIVVFGEAGIRIIKTDWNASTAARWTDVTVESGAAELAAEMKDVSAVLPLDVDHDGDLDLIVSSAAGVSLWANRGNSTFYDTTEFSELPAGPGPTSLAAVDWDWDADIDILTAGPNERGLGWLENMRHGQFRWRELDRDAAAGDAAALDLAALDADANGSWDVLSVGSRGALFIGTTNPGMGIVAVKPPARIDDQPAHRVTLADLDNDGHLDALLQNESGSLRGLRGVPSAPRRDDNRDSHVDRRNDGSAESDATKILDRRFVSFDGLLATPLDNVRSFDVADVDGDGGLDVAAATPDGIQLLRNEGASRNHWLALRVRGIDDNTVTGRVNHFGIGSLVEVRAGASYQPRVVTGPVTHIGLGSAETADLLRITFTNGVPQAVVRPKPDQVVNERMVLKGSCPFLYTWTGDRFEFYTDLLWAAPLGLQTSPGKLMPARPWEYLLVSGDAMQPRGGEYVLQVTEELWEAAYFDQIELLAVDHPADVEVFSNEKVGPAEMATFKIHTVRRRRRPVSAVDQQGRDVMPQLSEKDGDFAVLFDRRRRQGLVEPTYIELDLGPFDGVASSKDASATSSVAAPRVTLFLTGWIQPTDTSLNMAIAHDPRLEAPRPPALLVPDDDGTWREAMPFMGFPGGKPKTIAVDLTGVFAGDEHRLRIATTAEIYWDEAFYTVDDEPAETIVKRSPLVAADLHYRGFSQRRPLEPHQPESFDYNHLATEPQWAPMDGRFTRYGDVMELLAETDDRLVVMGAGDEMAIRFAEPNDPPPDGWRRDFILHNFGWDKDADLSTLYGQTSEPLPYSTMSSETDSHLGQKRVDPEYADYLRTYQTRKQPHKDFRFMIPR